MNPDSCNNLEFRFNILLFSAICRLNCNKPVVSDGRN